MAAGTRLYSDREAAAALREDPGMLQASSDPWEATHETIRYLCRLVKDSLADGVVQQCFADCDRFRWFGSGSVWASIWWWVKHKIKFVHHSTMLGDWIGAPDELQLLIRPDALLKMREPKGDCAVFTGLICALLDCAGLPWEIVTVAADPRQPAVFSHVYPRVILPDGRRVAMDAIRGMNHPGAEVPRQAVSALQVWNQDGEPIEDLDSGYRGLHGVGMQGLGDTTDTSGTGWDYNPQTDIVIPADYSAAKGMSGLFGMAGLYGLGDLPLCSDVTVDPGFVGPVNCDPSQGDVQYPVSQQQVANLASQVQDLQSQLGVPAGLSPQTTNTLANLASQLTSIFGQVVAPTTQVVKNANGSYSYVTPGSASGSALLPGGTALTSNSSLLVWGALGLGAIVLVMMLSKK